jgi:energy-converting hydrogenase Eha subunit H
MKRKMKFELFMNFAIPCILGAGIGFFGGILLTREKPDETALTELLDAAEIIAAEYAKLKRELARVSGINAEAAIMAEDLLYYTRLSHPMKKEDIIEELAGYQSGLCALLDKLTEAGYGR